LILAIFISFASLFHHLCQHPTNQRKVLRFPYPTATTFLCIFPTIPQSPPDVPLLPMVYPSVECHLSNDLFSFSLQLTWVLQSAHPLS
jgi:hypothetical protein